MDNQELHKKIQEQFEQLPLPDENQAWQKMKELLDRDDDRKPPFIFFTGCLVAGIALLIIGAAIFFAPKLFNKKTAASEKQKDTLQQKKNPNTLQLKKNRDTVRITTNTGTNNIITIQTDTKTKKNNDAFVRYEKPKKENIELDKGHGSLRKNHSFTSKKKIVSLKPVDKKVRKHDAVTDNKKETTPITHPVEVKTDSSATAKQLVTNNVVTKADTTVKQKDQLKKDSAAIVQQHTKKIAEKKSFYFGAGISLQQQIPLSGQQSVPYSYYGRKFSVSDYIPAPFVRLYREERWFLQLEFRYGAPQATKETTYSDIIKKDSTGTVSSSTTLRVKKTWYHQVPLSFNYYVLPKLPVGVGLMYSRFNGAVTEKEVSTRNSITQTNIITKTVLNIPSNTDSFFTKSQLHFLVQGEYQYKKFIGGFRYTMGLQPFIRYTENGILKEEKNYSFDIFVRYQFFYSKK